MDCPPSGLIELGEVSSSELQSDNDAIATCFYDANIHFINHYSNIFFEFDYLVHNFCGLQSCEHPSLHIFLFEKTVAPIQSRPFFGYDGLPLDSSTFLLGFLGNHPLATRSRCLKSSRMDQRLEKATTPRMVEGMVAAVSSEPTMQITATSRNTHQQRVPR